MSMDFVLPDLGEGVEDGDILIVSVLVSEGQQIEPQQPVIELETDKAVIEVPCPHAGRIAKLHVDKGDSVQVGQVLLTLESEEEADGEECQTPDASPVAATSAASVAIESEGTAGNTQQDAWGPIRREPLSPIRRTIAERMSRSADAIPHVTNFDDADVTELDCVRKNVPGELREAGIKLTMMPFVLKAVAAALGQHPLLNAEFDGENGQIVCKQYINLGVAVDTPRGLVVPVLRDAGRLGIVEIARELASLAQRARTAQFEIEELRGGSFTISNLGAVGGGYSTPIINFPESAILLLGRARWMPVVREGKIEPRRMLPLSLSYDHRLVDGASAARFLNDVIGQLQSPEQL